MIAYCVTSQVPVYWPPNSMHYGICAKGLSSLVGFWKISCVCRPVHGMVRKKVPVLKTYPSCSNWETKNACTQNIPFLLQLRDKNACTQNIPFLLQLRDKNACTQNIPFLLQLRDKKCLYSKHTLLAPIERQKMPALKTYPSCYN